jgi:hypothetical protein
VWGHASRPKDPGEAKARIDAFFDNYFERVEADGQDGPTRTCKLNWKRSALPNAEWPAYFLKPENKHLRLILFLFMGDRISFPLGIVFPIPLTAPASYDFLRAFSASAPFKMSAKHFSVVIPSGKSGKYAARKPDEEPLARLK